MGNPKKEVKIDLSRVFDSSEYDAQKAREDRIRQRYGGVKPTKSDNTQVRSDLKAVEDQHEEAVRKYGIKKDKQKQITQENYNSPQNAKALQQQLIDLKFLPALNEKGKTNADGYFQNRSKAALAQAQKEGYALKDGKLVKEQSKADDPYNYVVDFPNVHPVMPKSQSNLTFTDHLKNAMFRLSSPALSTFLDVGQRYSPTIALINGKVRGALKLKQEYGFGDKERDILSDANQFVFDNWEGSINNGIRTTNNLLSENQRKLRQLQQSGGSDEEIAKLQQEITKNKNSISGLTEKRNKFKAAGGLDKYLRAHPGEKVNLGVNWRYYKDNNRDRLPEGTIGGYANFSNPKFGLWAESTPVGHAEAKFGNTTHSWVYDPESDEIKTRASDSYDFNAIGTEGKGKVGDLRAAVGKDKDLNTASVFYSGDLKPIKAGHSNYINKEDFGSTYSGPGAEALQKAGDWLIGKGIGLFH